VGKSSLLSMVARGTDAAVSVVALVGERGREVNEFIQRDLGPEGLARSVVIVATSDEPALVRIRAAFTATRIAEWFRDQGKDVVLMMDSLTRFAMAQREVGLSAGEPPATRGYPPSVFSLLPKLLERAGAAERGSITGLYTVLVEGDDMNEPIADAARSILDGHVVLSRRLATAGHFPSIEVLDSISRVEPAITTTEQRALVRELRRLLAAYRDAKDLIEIGAYAKGANRLVDRAIELRELIDAFLRQEVSVTYPAADSWACLGALLAPATGPATELTSGPATEPTSGRTGGAPVGALAGATAERPVAAVGAAS
jgi:flagellum-specific ATP synthase